MEHIKNDIIFRVIYKISTLRYMGFVIYFDGMISTAYWNNVNDNNYNSLVIQGYLDNKIMYEKIMSCWKKIKINIQRYDILLYFNSIESKEEEEEEVVYRIHVDDIYYKLTEKQRFCDSIDIFNLFEEIRLQYTNIALESHVKEQAPMMLHRNNGRISSQKRHLLILCDDCNNKHF